MNEACEYYRPESRQALEQLLAGLNAPVRFLLGGDMPHAQRPDSAVWVDLQDCGLEHIEHLDGKITIGGGANLNQVVTALGLVAAEETVDIEFGANVRNSLSLANYLMSASKRSPFAALLLALQPQVKLISGESVSLESFQKGDNQANTFVEGMEIVTPQCVEFESIGRSPKDLPLLSVVVATDKESGKRVVFGGMANGPITAVLGDDMDGGESFARDLLKYAADEWASAEYRAEIAPILLSRALAKCHLHSVTEGR